MVVVLGFSSEEEANEVVPRRLNRGANTASRKSSNELWRRELSPLPLQMQLCCAPASDANAQLRRSAAYEENFP